MKNQYVKDLQNGQQVNDRFAVLDKGYLRNYRSKEGRWFDFEVSDRTGSILAKFWGGPDAEATARVFSSFQKRDVISIKRGQLVIDNFSNDLAIHLNEGSCEVTREANFDPADFATSTDRDIGEMRSRFMGEIESVSDPDIKLLLLSIFNDGDLMDRYASSSAAKRYHHNYVGGLLEHTLSMIEVAKTVAKQHEPDLNRDLLVAGCMLHDIGKIYEYETTVVTDFTKMGNMLGHIPIGANMVWNKIDGLADFPVDLRDKVLHLVLSHHGSREHGSPVEPRFPEAVALHKIDDCDAQVKHAIQEEKEARSDG